MKRYNGACNTTDTYEVTVTASDDDTGVGTGTGTVTVNNVAPTVSATDATIDENGVATISLSIDDPGTRDTFDVEVVWADGTTDTFTRPTSATGTQTFERTHQYVDDDPSGTAADTYVVSITVTDDDTGTAADTSTVTVHNVAPTASIDAVDQGGNLVGDVPPADVDVVLAGLAVDLHASFADLGALDTHDYELSWGEGTVEGGPATGAVLGTHTYAAPGSYNLAVTITDDDTGTVTVSQVLHVVDAAGAVEDAVDDVAVVADDPATDPAAADILRQVLEKLNGNNGGEATNGALDKLEQGDWESALTKLAKAAVLLQRADPLVAADLSPLVSQLVLTAKAVVVGQLGPAASIAIAEGDALWATGDAEGAITTYRQAL